MYILKLSYWPNSKQSFRLTAASGDSSYKADYSVRRLQLSDRQVCKAVQFQLSEWQLHPVTPIMRLMGVSSGSSYQADSCTTRWFQLSGWQLHHQVITVIRLTAAPPSDYSYQADSCTTRWLQLSGWQLHHQVIPVIRLAATLEPTLMKAQEDLTEFVMKAFQITGQPRHLDWSLVCLFYAT